MRPVLTAFAQPTTLAEALAARAGDPHAQVVAGGTGVMVERNAGRGGERPLIDLSRVAELAAVGRESGVLRLGANVTYTHVIEQLADELPGVAAAARTVASRAIRNRATLTGALVLADPSADVLAALAAARARLEIAGPAGVRRVAVEALLRVPGEPDLAAGELVLALLVPVARGPVAYAKAGARNAMARAVCGVCVELDPPERAVRIAVVGAAPRAVRAREAEAFAATLLDTAHAGHAQPLDADLGAADRTRLGELVAVAVDPTADARGSAAHRRRIAGVLAVRAFVRARQELG